MQVEPETLSGGPSTAAKTRLAARRTLRALPASFTAVSQTKDGWAIVALKGELDLASIAVFADCVAGIAFDVVQEVVFDFTELEFIDGRDYKALLLSPSRSQDMEFQ
jgi:hypothetical protein